MPDCISQPALCTLIGIFAIDFSNALLDQQLFFLVSKCSASFYFSFFLDELLVVEARAVEHLGKGERIYIQTATVCNKPALPMMTSSVYLRNDLRCEE